MNIFLNYFLKIFETPQYTILLGLIFVSVTGTLWCLYFLITQRDHLKKRLIKFIPGSQNFKASSALLDEENGGVVERISNPIYKVVLPEKEEQRKEGRLKLIRAGFRSKAAYRNYLVLRFLCAILFPVGFLFSAYFYKLSPQALAGGVLLALLGFFLPSFILKMMTLQRQQEITRALPDALDLMVVCAESGLGLDMTFKRVGEEIRPVSKNLSDEYQLTIMEIRAGKARSDSFRNMAVRTGVQEVNNLMTILVQASRFGTSVAKALRVHADAMRVKRRQVAEEKAAKVAVKLVFPLLLFIFPALMIVLAGPAFIKIFRVLLPALGGG